MTLEKREAVFHLKPSSEGEQPELLMSDTAGNEEVVDAPVNLARVGFQLVANRIAVGPL